ncbi:hypothetical protein BY996DRAFT_6419561 [Phakopsora pachyrhizi]|nr:hypothetical protein BY996DRAFT_6419561 [Phakopsora pachyrhizi]
MALKYYSTTFISFFIIFSAKCTQEGSTCHDYLSGLSIRTEPIVGDYSISLSEYSDKNWLSLGTPGLKNEKNCNKRPKITREDDPYRSSKEKGSSFDSNNKPLREFIEPNIQLNSHSYDTKTLRNQRQNFHAKSFDRPKLNPPVNFQSGIDVNQISGIPVPIRSNLRNDINLFDSLKLPNSASSSSAPTVPKKSQSKAEGIIDIPEFTRSQGFNYGKNEPNAYSKQPRTASSDASEHSEAELLLSLQHHVQEDKIRMPTPSTFQTNANELSKKRKSGDFSKAEKNFGGGYELANIDHIQANSGGAYKDSDQYHTTARNGKNVMQDNYSDEFYNAILINPESNHMISVDTKHRTRDQGAEINSRRELKIGYEHDLMKLLDLGTPLLQLDLIIEYKLRAMNLSKYQTARSILNFLNIVENQIKTHGSRNFFVTDTEILEFLGKPSDRNFALNYDYIKRSRSRNLPEYTSKAINRLHLIDFSPIVTKLLSDSEVDLKNSFPLNQWGKINKSLERSDLGIKSNIGKLFFAYTTIINKVFCNGAEDDGFIERQAKALKFYHCLLGNGGKKINGHSIIQEDVEKNDLIKSGSHQAEINILVKEFNEKYLNRTSNQSKFKFWMAWNLIEIWLIQLRNELYVIIKGNKKRIVDNFKPFINNMFYIILELNA